jgi:uncharacterized protein (TIGR00725 family)
MGPGNAAPEEVVAARETGRLIAGRGGVVICGGGGGVMEAASRGASEAGGVVVGILPGFSAGEANEFVMIPIVTGMSHARNTINVWTSEVIIAVGGSYGTLSEIALALKIGRPVVSLGSWRLDEIGCNSRLFHVVGTPEEAVDKAFELLEAAGGAGF